MRDITYKQVKGTSGRTWFVGLIPNAASETLVTNNASNTTRKGGGNGFGGATIYFKIDDGSEFEAHGPWHANAEALFADTGLDVRSLHLTRGIISTECEFTTNGPHYREHTGEILYSEDKPVMGEFKRIEKIAQALADLHGKKLFVSSWSEGGSWHGWVDPK